MKELAEQRVAFLAHQSQLDAIDTWRSQYRPIPTRNEAIRRLIYRGLEAEGEMSPVGDEGRSNGLDRAIRYAPEPITSYSS